MQSVNIVSLSARRAWIEIPGPPSYLFGAHVALRKESVDRNNFSRLHYNITVMVALRKESVDRNGVNDGTRAFQVESLSARRAWIEILAPRLADMSNASLSARRAWIEITLFLSFRLVVGVALRKESVDRNLCGQLPAPEPPSRSPQGERG